MKWSKFKVEWINQTKNGSESLYLDKMNSPVGPLVLGCTDKGVSLVDYFSSDKVNKSLTEMLKRRPLKIEFKDTIILNSLKDQLERYFLKEIKNFDLPIDSIGTDFQKKVWEVLCQIPFGETLSYTQQAKIFGNEKAIRAIASANGKNKISILLPCHRVIGKNGSLTGYAGGLDKKSWLLEHERD